VRGGGIGKAKQGMRMACAGRGIRKGRTGNENDRTWNGSLPLTALISSRDFLFIPAPSLKRMPSSLYEEPMNSKFNQVYIKI
jgi:hypothetical protein